MTTLLLVRHGRTTANGAGVLAGWTEGVSLDDAGREQVTALAQRLAPVPLTAVVTSPLQRCLETTDLMLAGRDDVPRHVDDRVGEVRYGDWSGEKLSKLAKDPLWKVVQAHPSAMTFPGEGGEALRDMQVRGVAAVREWNTRLGDDAVYAVVSHGDVIKAVLADALGMHLDQFQRLVADPASVSIVTYTALRPFVVRMNDGGGDLSFLAPKPKRKSRRKAGSSGSSSTRSSARESARSSDAALGGGAGPQA
ncbi:MAG TPA: histidine phosphatase family protein [Actinomycetes bacterium]|nr:histidine phosphatase family protein [Actinomycetes bacterium]